MIRIIFRNGDWNITPVDEMRDGEKIQSSKDFSFAKSPVTGNEHKISTKGSIEVNKMKNGAYCISCDKDMTVHHQEHSTKNDLIIPSGIYMITQRQEKDWFTLSTRKVID